MSRLRTAFISRREEALTKTWDRLGILCTATRNRTKPANSIAQIHFSEVDNKFWCSWFSMATLSTDLSSLPHAQAG